MANPELTSGQRFETTVAPQALFLMNSPFVRHHAGQLARHPDFTRVVSNEDRLRWLYARLFQRPPHPDEVKLLLSLLSEAGEQPRDAKAAPRKKGRPPSPAGDQPQPGPWERVIQTLLLTNEFVYIF